MRKVDRKAFKRSIWASLSKVIGIGLSAGAGGMIHRTIGDGMEGWSVAVGMAVVSFLLMLYAEYERELD